MREQKKLDKLRKIRAAAAELFTKKGFDATTTLEIAQHAGVGEGTVFLYATDKRDLLLQICMDELEDIRNQGFKKAQSEGSLSEQLVTMERVWYRQLAKNLPLERTFLEELTFCSGEQAARIQESRRRMMARIEKLVIAAEQAGKIKCNEDPSFVARHLYFSSLGAMRFWIAGPNPKVSEGIADLRRIYALHMRALQPSS